MKIKEITINNFKRFSDLVIKDIPESAKLVILVGPNGSGKTSLFDSIFHWYRLNKGIGINDDKLFYLKTINNDRNWYHDRVRIEFHNKNTNGTFYFRTAYRNESDFNISNLKKQNDPTTSIKFQNLTQNDIAVSENYQRLISLTLSGVYDQKNNAKTIQAFRDELIGRIKESLQNVFEDLTLSSIGDPLSNGSFYFKKGIVNDFHYKNLSGGEKSAFDIILDLIIKSSYYTNTIFCIDEPEAHMHTRLQSRLLSEIFRLIPSDSQLWLATHSFGMLKQAREIEKNNPNSVYFISFDNLDFDNSVVIKPTGINKTIWNRFIEFALDDFSNLIAPTTIVFCEGSQKGRKYKNFDSQIYSVIFNRKYPDVSFVSIGSSNEIENPDNQSIAIIKQVLSNSKITKVVDRDDKSGQEIDELKDKGIKVLNQRHIESYLLDDEVITKLCNNLMKTDLITDCLDVKQAKLQESITRGNPSDDIKSASGEIYIELKRILQLKQCGNTVDAFFRDTIAPIITEEMQVFKKLENELFG
jgi:predicted ATPase